MSDKVEKYEIIYTLAKPLYAIVEANSKEEALKKFEAKMSNNPTITIRSEITGIIETKVKRVSKI